MTKKEVVLLQKRLVLFFFLQLIVCLTFSDYARAGHRSPPSPFSLYKPRHLCTRVIIGT